MRWAFGVSALLCVVVLALVTLLPARVPGGMYDQAPEATSSTELDELDELDDLDEGEQVGTCPVG